MIVFFDFEVFMYDWLVVCINPINEEKTVIINDSEKLEAFYNKHKSDIWIGYNNRNYDNYILKAILLGFNPKEINDWIIIKKRKGWEYSSLFNQIQLYSYDCMSKFFGLKQLECFLGNNIKETSVPFNIDRKLTEEEISETVKYCTHDVEQTMIVFLKNKADFDAHLNLLKTFNLPINHINKTQAQLSALALGCTRKNHYDDWDYTIIDTLKIEKYKYVVEWFIDQKNIKDYNASLQINVCGVPHQFGWGGLHGAPDKPLHEKGYILHVDVTSFYPSIMIEYDMLSRNVKDKSVYKQIYNTRVELKKAGKKKEQAPYKIILNSTYGICKDKYSNAYDPRRANEVCVNGQLLLLDLLEHLEGHCQLIQSNTDGLIIKIPDTDEAFEIIDDICYEWESRTKMNLGLDIIAEIYQKDVNNYLWIDADGKLERKGGYVKELNDLDNDLPIVNKAMVDYMAYAIPVEKTINQSDTLKDFQKVVKISNKYICGQHNGKYLNDKTFRVFASTDPEDTAIYKVKDKKGVLTPEKFANTPLHCFIENSDINGKKPAEKLDRNWYIELAKTRLKQFGVMEQ
jgi:DNA polymerase